jgi:hypothetical protein
LLVQLRRMTSSFVERGRVVEPSMRSSFIMGLRKAWHLLPSSWAALQATS